MNNNSFFTVPNDMKFLSQIENIRIYGVLYVLFKRSPKTKILLDLAQIDHFISGTIKLQTSRRNAIIKALKSIDAVSCRGDRYILDTEKLYAASPYIECEIDVFMQLLNRPELLRHYLVIKGGRIFSLKIDGNVNVICKYSLEQMAELEGVSYHSIMRYNKALEEMKLIYVARQKYNGDKRESNIYSLYRDKDLVDSYVQSFAPEEATQANKDRSLSMRYSRFIKDPERYSKEETEALRAELVKYNARMDELADKNPDYLKRKKDLIFFDDSGQN